MIVEVKPERVTVHKKGKSPEDAITVHALHKPLRYPNPENPHEQEGQGEFLGMAVRNDRGHVYYAQLNQLEPVAS